MDKKTSHKENLVALRKVEGRVRDIQRMIGGQRYYADILIQLHSILAPILKVEDKILQSHLKRCTQQALKEESEIERQKKLDEVMLLFERFRIGR